tara:strand:- start:340 stop:633 length:294 start_codon:yes stop_codon:yes gene_type:complete
MEYHNCLALPEELENIVMKKKEELEKRDALEKRRIKKHSIRKYMLRFYETEDDIESGNFNEYFDEQELMTMKEILEIINDPDSDLNYCAKFEIIQNA